MIDICTTATLRPELLEQTFKSFFKYLFPLNEELNLIIHVDLIGPGNITEIIDVIKNYFGEYFHIRVSSQPNFCSAVKWCWNFSENEFLFHLEDDWICTGPHNWDVLMKLMKFHPNLGAIRLNKKQNWDWPIKIEEAQYDLIEEPLLKLSPTLYRGELCRALAPLLNENKDPEEQMRVTDLTPAMKKIARKYIYSHLGMHNRNVFIKDIGIEWRKQHNLRKIGNTWR